MQREKDAATMRTGAMLPDIDTLPRTECGTAVAHRHGELITGKEVADMSRHVVGTFGRVPEQWIAIRRQPLREAFEIAPHVGVGIFGQAERGAGVLQEQVTQALPQRRAGGQCRDLIGNLVEPPTVGGDFDFVLYPHGWDPSFHSSDRCARAIVPERPPLDFSYVRRRSAQAVDYSLGNGPSGRTIIIGPIRRA